MKKRIIHIVSLAAITGFLASVASITHAQTTDPLLTDSTDQSVFPQITAQPIDQAVMLGSPVTFLVQANNCTGFQWLRNGAPMDGQTNSSLVIASAQISDVAYYSCVVYNGGESVPTRAANLNVMVVGSSTATSGSSTKTFSSSTTTANSSLTTASMPAGGPITVFGTPLLGGGSQGSCPGPYTGCVAYTKPPSQGWGWAPISGAPVVSAADGSGRTDTKIQYCGAYGDNGCAQTTVSVSPIYSPVYQFGIYFTNNVPTNAYPIVLTGFNQ